MSMPGAQAAQAAPARQAATRPAAPRTQTGPAQAGPARETRRRGTGSTARTLGRLAATTALLTTLNGAAAYTYLQSDSGQVAALASTQQETFTQVAAAEKALPTAARGAKAGSPAETAYLTSATETSRTLTAAAARAAGGPADFADEVTPITEVAAAHTGYVATLERARATTGAKADALYRRAETQRDAEITPALTRLQEQNTARANTAGQAATLVIGGLAATTLASLATLLGGSVWLARRTKRLVNPGLLAATLLTAGVSGYAWSTMGEITGTGPFTAPAVLLGGLVAAALAWSGLESRRREYR